MEDASEAMAARIKKRFFFAFYTCGHVVARIHMIGQSDKYVCLFVVCDRIAQ